MSSRYQLFHYRISIVCLYFAAGIVGNGSDSITFKLSLALTIETNKARYTYIHIYSLI